MKENTVCFSGHRPEKLPGGGIYDDLRTKAVKKLLYDLIYKSLNDGYICFISGLAKGIDLWAAQYVVHLKEKYPEIKLISVKPTGSHGSGFYGEYKDMLETVIKNSDEIITTSEHYSRDCYYLRNKYMVERSAKLIACVDDYRSGTGQTINIAKRNSLQCDIINLRRLSEDFDNGIIKPYAAFKNEAYIMH